MKRLGVPIRVNFFGHVKDLTAKAAAAAVWRPSAKILALEEQFNECDAPTDFAEVTRLSKPEQKNKRRLIQASGKSAVRIITRRKIVAVTTVILLTGLLPRKYRNRSVNRKKKRKEQDIGLSPKKKEKHHGREKERDRREGKRSHAQRMHRVTWYRRERKSYYP